MSSAIVNYGTEQATIEFDPSVVELHLIQQAIVDAGYTTMDLAEFRQVQLEVQEIAQLIYRALLITHYHYLNLFGCQS